MSPVLPGLGILPVDKPVGPTSHEIVARARRGIGVRRIGHTGTLDPFASGLLLLCIGRATRLAEYLTGLEKTYEATARLGETTDTDDREGAPIRIDPGWRELDRASLEKALDGFRGRHLQRPPSFSAKRRGGERAYRRARRGETVVLDPVEVEIHETELLDVALPLVTFRVRCSGGTYIRALARDVGEALGTGAHLSDLRRTRIGELPVEAAVSGDELHDPDRVADAWLSPSRALAHLPAVELDEEDSWRLSHGQYIPVPASLPRPLGEDDLIAAVSSGELVAVCRLRGGELRPEKVLVDA